MCAVYKCTCKSIKSHFTKKNVPSTYPLTMNLFLTLPAFRCSVVSGPNVHVDGFPNTKCPNLHEIIPMHSYCCRTKFVNLLSKLAVLPQAYIFSFTHVYMYTLIPGDMQLATCMQIL